MLIEAKDWITLLTGIAGSAVITKYIEARQLARKQKADAPVEQGRLSLDREKAEEDADDRLIKNLIDEREKSAARYEGRITALETAIERQREREVMLITSNSEYQQQIRELTREVAERDKRIQALEQQFRKGT